MTPILLVFTKNFQPLDSFRFDFDRFGVYFEEYDDAETLTSRIESCCRSCIVVASAESCYSHLGKLTSAEQQYANLLGIVLFCGPHEDFYARWSANCTGVVKFLSHNFKEVRRAATWFLAGGDFDSFTGEAIPPPNLSAIAKPTEAKSLSQLSTPAPFYNNKRHSRNLEGQHLACITISLIFRCPPGPYVDDTATDELAALVALWHFIAFSGGSQNWQ